MPLSPDFVRATTGPTGGSSNRLLPLPLSCHLPCHCVIWVNCSDSSDPGLLSHASSVSSLCTRNCEEGGVCSHVFWAKKFSSLGGDWPDSSDRSTLFPDPELGVVRIWVGGVTRICSSTNWKVWFILLVCVLGAVGSVFDTNSVTLGHTNGVDLPLKSKFCGEDRTDPPDRSVLSPDLELGMVRMWGRVSTGTDVRSGTNWVSLFALLVVLVGAVVSVFGSNSVLMGGTGGVKGHSRVRIWPGVTVVCTLSTNWKKLSFLLVCILSAVVSVFDTSSVALGLTDGFGGLIHIHLCGEGWLDPSDWSVWSLDPGLGSVRVGGGIGEGMGFRGGTNWGSLFPRSVASQRAVVSVIGTSSVPGGGTGEGEGQSVVHIWKKGMEICIVMVIVLLNLFWCQFCSALLCGV